MSFSENLQTLRKAKNISQEQLAERLDVSRQAVSKWETDGGYPEMDKVIALCELFGCSMDELMTGKISVDKTDERRRYDSHYNRFSKIIATGVMLILFGVAFCTLISENENSDFMASLGTIVMFAFIAVAVLLLIVGGLEHSYFVKTHPTIPEIYTPEETEHFNAHVFPYLISGGVGLILLGLICTVCSELIHLELLGAAAFLSLIGIACWLFIFGGIQHSKYNIKAYNRGRLLEERPKDTDTAEVAKAKHRNILIGKICGTIMLLATAFFLTVGFVFEIWTPTWAVFPVGGILCGVVGLILGPSDNN